MGDGSVVTVIGHDIDMCIYVYQTLHPKCLHRFTGRFFIALSCTTRASRRCIRSTDASTTTVQSTETERYSDGEWFAACESVESLLSIRRRSRSVPRPLNIFSTQYRRTNGTKIVLESNSAPGTGCLFECASRMPFVETRMVIALWKFYMLLL